MISLSSVLPVVATVYAEVAKIDYSKQPPRSLQLSAGTAMAIAGFIVTFLVLGVFTVLIKLIAIYGHRVETRKASVPALPAKPTVAITPAPAPAIPEQQEIEEAAAAVAAVKQYHMSRTQARTVRGAGVDAWIIGERVFPPGTPGGDEISLRESVKWRRGK
jgi:Na+-transporting methylmalonyl-CoA/oxaloacetate decarboxylase gamma subunit